MKLLSLNKLEMFAQYHLCFAKNIHFLRIDKKPRVKL